MVRPHAFSEQVDEAWRPVEQRQGAGEGLGVVGNEGEKELWQKGGRSGHEVSHVGE